MNTRSLRSAAVSALLAAMLLSACGDKPETLVASAKDYLAKHDSKAAVIQIKNALQKAPDMPEARYLLGKALLEGGDAATAEVELRKALELKHPADEVVPLLARSILAKGQPKKVVDEFSTTELASPEGKADLRTTLASAQMALGNREAGEAALAAALAAKPDYVPALLLQARIKASAGDLAGALALIETMLGKNAALPEAWKFKGDILLAQANRDEALGAYRKALEVRSDYLPAHLTMLMVLLREGKLDEAGKELEALRKIAPKHPQTVFLGAQYAFQNKDYKLARNLMQQYHQGVPANPLSLQLAGAVEYQLGAFATAEDNLGKALQKAPGLGMARRLLIATYLRTGQPAKAMSTLEPVLDKIDNDANWLSLAGEVFTQEGDYKKAEEYYSKAAKLDPKDAAKRTRLALTHMVKGNVDSAFDELEGISASDTGTSADMALVAAHLRRNEIDLALKAIDTLEAKQPKEPGVHNLRGRTLLVKKDVAGARKSFEKALSISPGYFPAAVSLATLDMADKKPEDAKRRFESVLAVDSKNIQAQLALADLAAQTGGKTEEVAALIGKAVAANPAAPLPRLALINLYLRANNPKQAVLSAQEALTAIHDSVELVEASGRAQLAAGDTNQALISFNKLASLQPSSPAPYLRMAETQMAAKDRDSAIRSLKSGLALKPDYLEGQRALILVYLDGSRYPEALEVAREVQKQRPKEFAGYLLEGDIAVTRKSWADAAKAYRAGVERVPATELATKLYSVLIAGGQKGEADKMAATWLKDHPKDAGFRLHLAETATNRQDYTAAAQYYRTLLEEKPDNATLLNNLAWVAGQLKDPKALEYAEKANQLAPDQPAILDTLAMLLVERGDTQRGLQLYKKALQLSPEAAPIRLNMAKALAKAGQKAEARKELDELTKLGDKFAGQAEVTKLRGEI